MAVAGFVPTGLVPVVKGFGNYEGSPQPTPHPVLSAADGGGEDGVKYGGNAV